MSLTFTLILLENSNLGSRTFEYLPSIFPLPPLFLSGDRNRKKGIEGNDVVCLTPLVQLWPNMLSDCVSSLSSVVSSILLQMRRETLSF